MFVCPLTACCPLPAYRLTASLFAGRWSLVAGHCSPVAARCLFPPFLAEIRSAIHVVDTHDDDYAIPLRIDDAGMDDPFIIRGPVEDPAAGRRDAVDAAATPGVRLAAGRPSRKPDAALPWRGQVPRGNPQAGTVLIVADHHDARRLRRRAMDDDGRASAQQRAEHDDGESGGAHDGLLQPNEYGESEIPAERRAPTRAGHVAAGDREWRDPPHKHTVIVGENPLRWHDSFRMRRGVRCRPVRDGA